MKLAGPSQEVIYELRKINEKMDQLLKQETSQDKKPTANTEKPQEQFKEPARGNGKGQDLKEPQRQNKNETQKQFKEPKQQEQAKQYKCEVCGQEFSSPQALSGHMKVHS